MKLQPKQGSACGIRLVGIPLGNRSEGAPREACGDSAELESTPAPLAERQMERAVLQDPRGTNRPSNH